MKLKKEIDQYNSFAEILKDVACVFGDRVYLVEGNNKYTFTEFNSLVNRCCRWLADEGVRQGDIISLILKNSVDYLLVYFAALKMGCRINPFPFHLGSAEIGEKLVFVQPALVFAHAAHAEKMAVTGLQVKMLQKDGENILQELLEKYSGEEPALPKVDPNETSFMYYSSGTTGSPKIIEYTAGSEILTMASLLRAKFIEAGACHLCFLPLGHTAAIRYSILPCLLTGSKVMLYESFWKIRDKLWEVVRNHSATFFEVVPSILIAILNAPDKGFKREKIDSLKFIGCGSAYLPKNLQDDFEKKFSVPVANMYGLSETGPTHFDDPFEPGRKTGSVGRPFDIMDVKIFDEAGKEVKPGVQGEFGVKGPSLLKCYYKNEEHYTACFNDSGYFMTGDIGYIDQKGIHYYVDRKKDMIIKGGVNIVPSQIDEIILTHESVEEVATVGKPDLFLGETIKSYVVLKQGKNIDTKSLRAYCKERLGDFKTPSEFEFIDEIPKGPSGKILKRELRQKEQK